MDVVQGIYCLYFEQDDSKVYIGQSINIHKRYKEHCYTLIAGNHANYKMQELYVKHGLPKEIILEVVEHNAELDHYEKYWVEEFDSFNTGLNLTPGGYGTAIGDKHPSALYTEDVYVAIITELAYTLKTVEQIATQLNISIPVIKNIARGSSHTVLQDKYPQIYADMIKRNGTRREGAHSGIAYPNVVSPDGEIFSITNATRFAKEHGLHQGHFAYLLSGKQKIHKGWKLA